MVRRGGGYMSGDGEGYMTKSWLRFKERSCASRPITMGIFGCRFSCIFFASILSIAIKIINMQHAACNIRQTTLVCNRWGVFSVQDNGGRGRRWGREWSLLVCGVNSRLRLYLFFIRRRGESADLRAAWTTRFHAATATATATAFCCH